MCKRNPAGRHRDDKTGHSYKDDEIMSILRRFPGSVMNRIIEQVTTMTLVIMGVEQTKVFQNTRQQVVEVED